MNASFFKHLLPTCLDASQRRRSLPFVVKDGILSQLIESLTGGPIAIAIALWLGASNALIGYLLALPFLCNIGQFPGILLLEKFKYRKLLSACASTFARLSFLGVFVLVFYPNMPNAPFILACFYTVRYIGTGCSSASWNSWMKDLIPGRILGRFFSTRFTYMMLTSLIVNLIITFFLAFWPFEKNYFYAILILVAGLSAFYGFYIFYHISEPISSQTESENSLLKKVKAVFADSNFVRLILFLGFFNFSINLAVPFFSVFVLQQLKLDLSIVLLLVTLTQLTSIAVMRVWGRIADYFSNKSVLAVTGPLYVLSIFLFLFTNFPQTHLLTIPLLIFIYALVGVAQSGVTLATNNIALKLAPKGSASIYLSTNAFFNACMAGTAPILGGLFADFFKGKSLTLTLDWNNGLADTSFYLFGLEYWDFFFFFATILGALSLCLLKQVREEGEVNERLVLSHFFSGVSRNISSYLAPQKFFLLFSHVIHVPHHPKRSSSKLFQKTHDFDDKKEIIDLKEK